MLIELICQNGFYMSGTSAEIRQRLAEHTNKYVTVKELLEDMTPK